MDEIRVDGARHRVKPELFNEQLEQILQARPHPGATDGQVQLAQVAAVVRVVPRQQVSDRATLGVDVPMAARRGVHVAVEVQAQQRVTVDPELELRLVHGWVSVGGVRNEPDQDEQSSVSRTDDRARSRRASSSAGSALTTIASTCPTPVVAPDTHRMPHTTDNETELHG